MICCTRDGTMQMDIKEGNALMNLMLYVFNIDKCTRFTWIISKRLGNVAVSTHSLDVGIVGTTVTAKFVMSLSATNYERKLEMNPHETVVGYPYLVAMFILTS